MIVRSKISTQELTEGKLYLVLGIWEYRNKKISYDIINDHFINESNLVDGKYQVGYISISSYSSENFTVVEDQIPEDWISEERGLFMSKVKYTSFPFFVNNKAFYSRLIHDFEPERSIFYYELIRIYKESQLGDIVPVVNLIEESHLVKVNFPQNDLEGWVDPIDGKIYDGHPQIEYSTKRTMTKILIDALVGGIIALTTILIINSI